MSALELAQEILDKTKGRSEGSFEASWFTVLPLGPDYWEDFLEALQYEAQVRHIDLEFYQIMPQDKTRVKFFYHQPTAKEAYDLYRDGKMTRAQWADIMFKEVKEKGLDWRHRT